MTTSRLAFLPFVFLAACSGGASMDSGNGAVASLTEKLASLGIAADASVPCPTVEPKAGGSCDSAVENVTCTYGECTDPNGSTELKCESDVWTDVGGSVCRSADAGTPAPACSSGAFGNANGACSSDESFFDSALADCAASKLVLTAFKADEHCAAGSSSSATYSCCATVPAGGSTTYFGNANGVCDPDTSLFANAEASCTADGQDVTAFTPSESCGKGSSASGSFTCTPVAGVTKPPPVEHDAGVPAPKCASGAMANAKGVCSSDESFFESAVADCASSKQILSSFTADEHCGAGSSSSATYSCCPTAPNEPAGGVLQNADGVCDTDASLFASAEADCSDAKGSVVVFTPNESCGKGSSSGATYACN